jgi:hypothetical protein
LEPASERLATFEKSMRLAPDFDQPYLNLAGVYAVEETPDQARAVLQEFLKQHPEPLWEWGNCRLSARS